MPIADMGKNIHGTPIDPTEWNRNDGFSPGTPIILHVQGIDLATSRRRPRSPTSVRRLRSNAPIVLLDATTGRACPTGPSSTPTTATPTSRRC